MHLFLVLIFLETKPSLLQAQYVVRAVACVTWRPENRIKQVKFRSTVKHGEVNSVETLEMSAVGFFIRYFYVF